MNISVMHTSTQRLQPVQRSALNITGLPGVGGFGIAYAFSLKVYSP
jgi:hypothetical protein